jgi:hypothetical protein
MLWLITKYAITAAVVVLVSEVAKRSDRLGALLASLPLVTLLTLVWLYVEKQPAEKIANHAWYTFWYVVPTLPMFLIFPALLARFGFWPALGLSAIITIASFSLFALAVRPFGRSASGCSERAPIDLVHGGGWGSYMIKYVIDLFHLL